MNEGSATRQHQNFPLLPEPGRLRRVLVVGAGVAGLSTARQLLRLGVQVLVLEAGADVGGIWVRNYHGFGLQIPWRQYQFPEFLWPKHLQPKEEYASGREVQDYVKAYAKHFGIMEHIRFRCKLLRLRWCGVAREWEVLYCDSVHKKFFKTRVDYTVICNGIYSHPCVPQYKGSENFVGIQVHAQDFTDMSIAKGRRVVIVGAGKTAQDCVSGLVASRYAASVTVLYRQAHWPVPRSVLGLPIRSLLFSRVTVGMLPPYYTAGRAQSAVHSVTTPLKRLFWRGFESIISRKFKLSGGKFQKPCVGLPTDLFYGGQILDESCVELMQCEALTTIRGEITQFVRNGVILQDGSFRPADVVLYCTGYTKSYDYFEGDMRARLGLQKDGLYLYRNCLPTAVPHLAFVGSEVSTYSNILTHGLQALWLANLLAGRMALPSIPDMAADIRAQQRWRREVMPTQRSRGAVLMMYGMKYHDQLLEDMGHKPQRKGLNPFAECFGAYSSEDYRPLWQGDLPVLPAARPAEEQRVGRPAIPAAAVGASTAVGGAPSSITGSSFQYMQCGGSSEYASSCDTRDGNKAPRSRAVARAMAAAAAAAAAELDFGMLPDSPPGPSTPGDIIHTGLQLSTETVSDDEAGTLAQLLRSTTWGPKYSKGTAASSSPPSHAASTTPGGGTGRAARATADALMFTSSQTATSVSSHLRSNGNTPLAVAVPWASAENTALGGSGCSSSWQSFMAPEVSSSRFRTFHGHEAGSKDAARSGGGGAGGNSSREVSTAMVEQLLSSAAAATATATSKDPWVRQEEEPTPPAARASDDGLAGAEVEELDASFAHLISEQQGPVRRILSEAEGLAPLGSGHGPPSHRSQRRSEDSSPAVAKAYDHLGGGVAFVRGVLRGSCGGAGASASASGSGSRCLKGVRGSAKAGGVSGSGGGASAVGSEASNDVSNEGRASLSLWHIQPRGVRSQRRLSLSDRSAAAMSPILMAPAMSPILMVAMAASANASSTTAAGDDGPLLGPGASHAARLAGAVATGASWPAVS